VSAVTLVESVELLAPIGRLQLHDVGEVLGAGEALGQVEAGIDVTIAAGMARGWRPLAPTTITPRRLP
jgi:hypothetical protein